MFLNCKKKKLFFTKKVRKLKTVHINNKNDPLCHAPDHFRARMLNNKTSKVPKKLKILQRKKRIATAQAK